MNLYTDTATETDRGAGARSSPDAAGLLPHEHDGVVLADGGLETWLLFEQGIELPDFAAFPLLDRDDGRRLLTTYFNRFADVAEARGAALLVDTATWRASADWGQRLGYDRAELSAVNERAVRFAREFAESRPSLTTFVNGAIGPRGDGYVVGETMSIDEATSFHSLQTRAFARAGADLATAVTMTYVEEAIGVARAAGSAGLPVAVGFTTETDGRLPSGIELGEAIEAVDAATDGAVAYYMVNCAHPSHFRDAFVGGAPWLERIKAIRANASRMSHDELDAAVELDAGDASELAAEYAELRSMLPDLRVVGGCCGTNHTHIEAIADRLT